MAYVLGFIYADGAIEDVRKSSRTCYLSLVSKDKSILKEIRKAIGSKHNLYRQEEKKTKFGGKIYLCKEKYCLRIGSKAVFQDLVDLGLTPRKSLRLKFPKIPKKFLKFFIRGYFDGDGCACIYRRKGRESWILQVIFTSGTKEFLEILQNKIATLVKVSGKKCCGQNKGAFDIRYKSKESLKILKFIYEDLCLVPYLKRKYLKFIQAKNLFEVKSSHSHQVYNL